LKRIFFLLLVLCSVAAIAFFLWRGPEQNVTEHSLLEGVPSDAFLILDVPDAKALEGRLNGSSLIWEELQLFPAFSGMDSLLASLAKGLGSRGFVLSMHPSGMEKNDWILSSHEKSIPEWLNIAIGPEGSRAVETQSYDGSSILKVTSEEKQLFICEQEEGLIISPSRILLEKAIREVPGTLMKDKSFRKVHATRATESLANLYLNHAALPEALKGVLNSPPKETLGGWSLSDIYLSSNAFQAVGLVAVSDSAGHTLASYASYRPVGLDQYLDYLPDLTAQFTLYGQSRPNSKEADDLLSLGFGGHVEGVLEASAEGDPLEAFVLCPLVDAEAVIESLPNAEDGSKNLIGLPLYTIDKSRLDPELVKSFKGADMLQVIIVKDMMLLSADDQTLQRVLVRVVTLDKTLASDAGFSSLEDDISDASSYVFYMNIARASGGLLDEQLKQDWHPGLLKDIELLQRFHALVLQYEPANQGLYHMNLLLKYNPLYKEEAGSIWEQSLDTLPAWGPHLVKNHYTKQLEVLIQDVNDQLYLISNTGKVLWKKDIGEPIRSEVTQVDALRNGKLQMIFNTDTRIFLLDRNGKDVDGFPINLGEDASSELAAMDYDGQRKYRLLIGTVDGKVRNYDISGKPVKGWEFKTDGQEKAVGRIEHFVISGKDYISCISADGQVRFLERSGKERHRSTGRMTNYDGKTYKVMKGKNIGSTRILYATDFGELRELTVDGSDRSVMEGWADLQYWYNDKWLGIKEDEILTEWSESPEVLKLELDGRYSGMQALDGKVLVWEVANGLATLYDDHLNPILDSPVLGKGPGAVADMDGNGVLDLILTDSSGRVYMYALK
jgi:hypothetical protein